MASVFGHSIVGYTLTKVIDNQNTKWLLVVAIISTILPDLDVIGFKRGIPYMHPFGHRGFSHSVVFALLWALLLMFTLGKKHKLIWFLVIFLATLSHGALDAMTTGGKGVGFLIPFNNNRFFFPVRIIKVSPLGIKHFFSEWGLKVIFSEFKYVVVPCFIIFGIRFLTRLRKSEEFES
ncbi:metal-dependent hydrolase [Snuella sedimenti]|uniref:Metal-dependent hydrolase n=1 Tax=Snuella sedimenti TaxID=2798802 RepID=A0A8J7LRK5_9FLAO|nr:metal-dependent hydrolase [Snuella sedimenti]MBJ6366576.1 metal-dependent hydrolase [Snuella sedimenti]